MPLHQSTPSPGSSRYLQRPPIRHLPPHGVRYRPRPSPKKTYKQWDKKTPYRYCPYYLGGGRFESSLEEDEDDSSFPQGYEAEGASSFQGHNEEDVSSPQGNDTNHASSLLENDESHTSAPQLDDPNQPQSHHHSNHVEDAASGSDGVDASDHAEESAAELSEGDPFEYKEAPDSVLDLSSFLERYLSTNYWDEGGHLVDTQLCYLHGPTRYSRTYAAVRGLSEWRAERKPFKVILWINASSEETMLADLEAIAQDLELVPRGLFEDCNTSETRVRSWLFNLPNSELGSNKIEDAFRQRLRVFDPVCSDTVPRVRDFVHAMTTLRKRAGSVLLLGRESPEELELRSNFRFMKHIGVRDISGDTDYYAALDHETWQLGVDEAAKQVGEHGADNVGKLLNLLNIFGGYGVPREIFEPAGEKQQTPDCQLSKRIEALFNVGSLLRGFGWPGLLNLVYQPDSHSHKPVDADTLAEHVCLAGAFLEATWPTLRQLLTDHSHRKNAQRYLQSALSWADHLEKSVKENPRFYSQLEHGKFSRIVDMIIRMAWFTLLWKAYARMSIIMGTAKSLLSTRAGPTSAYLLRASLHLQALDLVHRCRKENPGKRQQSLSKLLSNWEQGLKNWEEGLMDSKPDDSLSNDVDLAAAYTFNEHTILSLGRSHLTHLSPLGLSEPEKHTFVTAWDCLIKAKHHMAREEQLIADSLIYADPYLNMARLHEMVEVVDELYHSDFKTVEIEEEELVRLLNRLLEGREVEAQLLGEEDTEKDETEKYKAAEKEQAKKRSTEGSSGEAEAGAEEKFAWPASSDFKHGAIRSALGSYLCRSACKVEDSMTAGIEYLEKAAGIQRAAFGSHDLSAVEADCERAAALFRMNRKEEAKEVFA